MADKDKNLNAGHRKRVKERFIKEGNLDSFRDYEILELLLFYVYPMKDTKPIAKKLLAKYNSLHNLLNSRPEELMMYEGLTENVAVFLTMLPYISRRYMQSYYEKGMIIDNLKKAVDYLSALLKAQNYESMYLISLDLNKKLIASDRISSGSGDSVVVNSDVVLEKALLNRARFVIIAHNHPCGSCEPSEGDFMVTKELYARFSTLNIRVMDHIIICGNKNFSFAKAGYFGMNYK